MPREIKNYKKMKEIKNIEEVAPESKQLLENRKYRFVDILGEEWPEENILSLVESDIDYHDLSDLIDKGCEPSLAIKILI